MMYLVKLLKLGLKLYEVAFKPKNISFEEAASLPLVGLEALL